MSLPASGLVRSEAAVAILIQKEEMARRSYCRILNIGSNTDGFKHAGINYPSRKKQEKIFRRVYAQLGLDPAQHPAYIETHGTGTPVGDPEELAAISSTFCASTVRKEPLLVGSVKSNMGHSESAAGLAGLAKATVTIQTGAIPGNLHFKKPRPELNGLMGEGKLRVGSCSASKFTRQE